MLARPLFLFLILASAVSAYDCDLFSGIDKDNCLILSEEDGDLVADLIYTSNQIPNHDFIDDYNSGIQVNHAPGGTIYHNKGIIQSAWLSLLTVQPSVLYQDALHVPKDVEIRSEYSYNLRIPEDYHNDRKRDGATCKIIYSLDDNSEALHVKVNENLVGQSKQVTAIISQNSTISVILKIDATLNAKEYEWDRYCCGWTDGDCTRYCYDCEYEDTDYRTYEIEILDQQDVILYNHMPQADFTLIGQNYGSSIGEIELDDKTSISIKMGNSNYSMSRYVFRAEFIHEPFDMLQMYAADEVDTDYSNLIKDGNLLHVKDPSGCTVSYSDLFESEVSPCSIEIRELSLEPIERTEFSSSWVLLLRVLVFLLINYLIFMLIKKYWGKHLVPVAVLFLFIPLVAADDCGLTNLASCIPEKIYDFILDVLNAPIQPLLTLIRTMMETPPSIDIFKGVWAIIVYCISMFYGLLFIYSGFQFLFSGHNVIRREIAKDWLKNTVIMIVLVQSSFYLYGLVLELGSIMTTAVLSMVDEHFFLITADNIINIGLEFFSVTLYVITLFITILFLIIRFLVVAFGVIFVPIGIFCYFIPPLKSYGRLTLNILGMFTFITFLDAIIILACSMLIEIPLFENIKILVMICCFCIVNLLYFMLSWHVIMKSSVSDSGEKVAQAVKYIAMFA